MNRAWKIAHTNLRDPENIVLLDNSNAALTEKYLSDPHGVKEEGDEFNTYWQQIQGEWEQYHQMTLLSSRPYGLCENTGLWQCMRLERQQIVWYMSFVSFLCVSKQVEGAYSNIRAMIGSAHPIILKFSRASDPWATPATIASRKEPPNAKQVMTAPQRNAMATRVDSLYGGLALCTARSAFHPCSGVSVKLMTLL